MIDPDCRDGKHRACLGNAWDDENDRPTDCACSCHVEGVVGGDIPFLTGSVRAIHYSRPRDADGRYPVTYWGSLEEQIAEATEANARSTSRSGHEPMALYTMASDCRHENPDEDERFDGVDDLIDEWIERNCAGLTWKDGWELHWKNRKRAIAMLPLAAEFERASRIYGDTHNNVCLESPMGTVCGAEECADGEDDSGYQPGPCWLPSRIREQYDDFWYLVSSDAVVDRQWQPS